MGTWGPLPHPNQHCKMRGWNRPTARIYASNGAPAGYTSSSRSARATSVAAGSQSSSASSFVRSASVAPSSQLEGYSGIYGRQLAQLNQRTSSGSSAAARVSTAVSSSKTVQEKTTTTVEKTTKSKVDLLKEQKTSLEYGKSSKCAALRRAEIHAQNSGKDPRDVPVPRNVDDDICYLVADIHLTPYSGKEVSSASSMSQQGRLKIERMEKELSALTSSAMSYKSLYSKSASQMAAEAMSAAESEAASSKKIRKTVVESSRRQVAAA